MSCIFTPEWADITDYSEKEKITQASWFLERVDDAYDCTYCDFYAKIEKK